jgi:uncharacterized alkaline shock family protein YloU
MSMVVVTDAGTITVTDGALTRIVVQATEQVVGARLRRKRAIEFAVGDGGTSVQLELAVAYGHVLPEVARDVQARVGEALGTMCGVHVDAVDISIEELV